MCVCVYVWCVSWWLRSALQECFSAVKSAAMLFRGVPLESRGGSFGNGGTFACVTLVLGLIPSSGYVGQGRSMSIHYGETFTRESV